MANRHTISTKLSGFINVYEDSEKYQTRTFAYTIPSDVVELLEKEREELLDWARSKSSGRVQEAFAPWDDDGVAKYSYGEARPKNPIPVFVDSTGVPLETAVLRDIREGTEARLIIQHKPYAIPGKIGTSLKVVGFQLTKLVAGNGASDSGDLSVDEVVGMFGAVKGFSQADPAVRKTEEPVAAGDSYDF
mgnify:CR=1 FL=1